MGGYSAGEYRSIQTSYARVVDAYLQSREDTDRSAGQGHPREEHDQGMVERIDRDEMMMRIAAVVSQRGTCERASVGAVIALEGRIISSGYVGSPSGLPHCTEVGCEIGNHGGCRRTVHAESNAIAFAAREGIATRGSTIYVTHSPCYDCAKLILNAGIRRVVYEVDYRDGTGRELLRAAGIELILWS